MIAYLDNWQHSVIIFSNFSILSRLISSYLLIIFVVLLSGIYTISNLNDLNEFIQTITANDTRMINLSEECQEILYKSRAAEEKFFVSRDVSYFQQSKALESDFIGRMTEITPLADTARKQNLLGVIQALHTRYGALFNDMTAQIGKDYERIRSSSATDPSRSRSLRMRDSGCGNSRESPRRNGTKNSSK